MPVAANYTTHLYCDCDECEEKYQKTHIMHEFCEYIDESWSGTMRQARKDGWRISNDKLRAYAPSHKVKRNIKEP